MEPPTVMITDGISTKYIKELIPPPEMIPKTTITAPRIIPTRDAISNSLTYPISERFGFYFVCKKAIKTLLSDFTRL
jgi:hypothetical protein